jgi:hypothetical protein
MKNTINIICHDDGWILNKMGAVLCSYLQNSRLIYPRDLAKLQRLGELDQSGTVNYYINYSLYRYRSKSIDAAWFTHIETDPRNSHLRQHFLSAAATVDLAIFNAPMYQRECGHMTKESCVIIPGIDLQYECKLNLGIAGREYEYTDRKNPVLISQLKAIPWLNVEFTNGKLAPEDLPSFYQRQDYIVVTSKVEGGPMSVLESLAMGKKVIFPRGVGFGELFINGLFFYELDRPESLMFLLQHLYGEKKAIRSLVEEYTWDRFAESHAKAFNALLLKNRGAQL